jgi:hypothetical protein
MHFSDLQLKILTSIEGKTLKKIVCYFWVNRLNPNESIELIDNIELFFNDETSIVITCNEDGNGLEILNDFNYEEEKNQLKQEFGDKIKIIPIDASTTKMWSEVIGENLESIQLSREEDKYLNDAIILDFGIEKRTINLSPTDGLIIDYWEE